MTLFLCLLALPSLAADLPLNPVAVCAVAQTAPEVDGDLSDPAWRRAAFLGPFVRVATHDAPTQRTLCRVTRTAAKLYVAVECFEDALDALAAPARARDDAEAWADDCIGLFIAPDDPRNVYFHIVVTAAGAVFDERCLDSGQDRQTSWDCSLTSVTRRLADRWTCEVALPLAELSERKPVAGSWSFAVTRAEQPHREWSSWCPMNAGFHEYQAFGTLLWADGPIITDLDLPTAFVGHNEFRICLGDAPAECSAELQVLRRTSAHPKLSARLGANSSAAFTYQVLEEGPGALRVVATSGPDNATIYATPPISFNVSPVQRLTRDMTTRLATAASAAAQAPAAALRHRLAAEIAKLQAANKRVAAEAQRLTTTQRPSRARWQELYRQALALGPQARRVELRCELAASSPDKLPTFALGTDSSLRKLPPDDCAYSLSRRLDLSCARRERESGQVIVASLGEALKDVRVEWTGLSGPGGARLDHDAVEVHRVDYVTTREPVYPVERVGRWPDPLMPPEPFDVPAGEIRPLWVTVAVPADAPSGEYGGTLTVSAAGEAPQAVTLRVQVWDITLPLHGRLRTGFGNVFRGDVCQWYGFRGEPPADFRRKLYDVLLRNRVNPAGLYVREVWPLLEDLDWCRERGLNALCLGNLSAATPKRLQELYEANETLRDHGYPDLGYVYGFSNLQREDLERAREAFSRVRQKLPGLRRVCPVPPMEPLWGYVNVWATLTSDYDHLSAQRRRRAGDEVWWYVCCGPRHPYANFFIDYPATDARTLFWAAFKYGVTGFLYYEVAMWVSNMLTEPIADPTLVPHEAPAALAAMREGKRWPDVPWNTFTFSRYNGDGQLIYPGRNETPLPSLRLEVIRDGIEDYELLALLEDAALALRNADTRQQFAYLVDEAMRLVSVQPEVITDLTRFTEDPQVILAEREKVAEELVRVQRAVREVGGQN